MNADIITVEILDDGSIKIETDRISGPNHVGAESLLREISKAAGGTTTRRRRVHVGQTITEHEHEHGPETHTHS